MSTPPPATQGLTDTQLEQIRQKYAAAVQPYHQFDCDLEARALREAVETIPTLFGEVGRLRGELRRVTNNLTISQFLLWYTGP